MPTVSIDSPTAAGNWQTDQPTITIGGVADDDVSLSRVGWVSDQGPFGDATGTTSWSAADIPLSPGKNVITVTAYDGQSNTATDVITVLRGNAGVRSRSRGRRR